MRAAVALVAVVLLAGCGGGKQAAPTVPAVDRGAQLDRYLERMRVHEQRFDRIVDRVSHSFRGVDSDRPDADWTRAERRLAPLAGSLNRLGSAIGGVKPPPALRAAHRRLAESTLAFADYVDTVDRALRVRIPQTLLTAVTTDTTPIRNARIAWIRAVERYGASIGQPPPEWLVPSPAG